MTGTDTPQQPQPWLLHFPTPALPEHRSDENVHKLTGCEVTYLYVGGIGPNSAEYNVTLVPPGQAAQTFRYDVRALPGVAASMFTLLSLAVLSKHKVDVAYLKEPEATTLIAVALTV